MDETKFEFAVTYILNSGREVLGTVGAINSKDAVRAVELSLTEEHPHIIIKLSGDKYTAISKSRVEQFTVDLVYDYTRTPGMERQKGGPKIWLEEI